MILSVIYLFEIVSGITVLIEKSHLGGILTEHLNKTFNRIESNNEIWNHLQREVIINYFFFFQIRKTLLFK